jgi:hypothetical protein
LEFSGADSFTLNFRYLLIPLPFSAPSINVVLLFLKSIKVLVIALRPKVVVSRYLISPERNEVQHRVWRVQERYGKCCDVPIPLDPIQLLLVSLAGWLDHT